MSQSRKLRDPRIVTSLLIVPLILFVLRQYIGDWGEDHEESALIEYAIYVTQQAFSKVTIPEIHDLTKKLLRNSLVSQLYGSITCPCPTMSSEGILTTFLSLLSVGFSFCEIL